MVKNIGYKVYDLTKNEEILIHTPKEYLLGEIIELKCPDCIHECKILEMLQDEEK